MKVFAFTCSLILLMACRSGQESRQTSPVGPDGLASVADDNFNAVLYMQSAAEYEALTRQAYTSAELALERALADPSWTADVAQLAQGRYVGSPPAVILDIDETVLDNSPFQAQLIRDKADYSSKAWLDWTKKASALALPGVEAYLKAAKARGITLFYITNRLAEEEEATRRNLLALGFPLDGAIDVVLTKGERSEWKSSDKTPRRAEVAKKYRVVQMIGDNLGDFVEAKPSVSERKAAASQYASYWGQRWIMLPNPSYGDWETVLYGKNYNLSAEEKRELKRKNLRLD